MSKSSQVVNLNTRKKFKLYKTKHIDWGITLQSVYEKYGGKCNQCHCHTEMGHHPPIDSSATVEHIQPLSKGGNHIWNNIELLCWKCNRLRNHAALGQKVNPNKHYKFIIFGYQITVRKVDLSGY